MSGGIFVGFLPEGGPTHSGSFIVGKLTDMDEKNHVVKLQNPIWIQRIISSMVNNQPVFTHQVVVDPFFQCTRDGLMDFNVDRFTGIRLLDPQVAKDMDAILAYEKNLTGMYAAISGIELPQGGKLTNLKPV